MTNSQQHLRLQDLYMLKNQRDRLNQNERNLLSDQKYRDKSILKEQTNMSPLKLKYQHMEYLIRSEQKDHHRNQLPQRLGSVDGHPFPVDRPAIPSHMTNDRMHKMT